MMCVIPLLVLTLLIAIGGGMLVWTGKTAVAEEALVTSAPPQEAAAIQGAVPPVSPPREARARTLQPLLRVPSP